MIVKAIAPVYGGVNLEDISAPRCFEIERRLRDELDIPVFHDDQHGTAIVVLAALTQRAAGRRQAARRRAHRRLGRRRRRPRDRAAARRPGRHRHHRLRPARRARPRGRRTRDEFRGWIAEQHQPFPRAPGTLQGGAAPGPTSSSASRRPTCSTATTSPPWPRAPIVFALANPDPEVDPVAASQHAAVVATGRSDYANQINNVLAFPGFFRGLLDAGASDITDEMMIAAATAIADCVHPDELNASYIVPSVFDPEVAARGGRRGPQAAGGRHAMRPHGIPASATAPAVTFDVTVTWLRPATLDDRLARRGCRAGAGSSPASGRSASRSTPSTSRPTATTPTWCRGGGPRRSRPSTSTAGGATEYAALLGLPTRRSPTTSRPGARQARARADRGPADRLRGRLRRAGRRRGGRRGRRGRRGPAASRCDADRRRPFNGIRFKSFEAPTRQRGPAHLRAVRRGA